MRRSFLIILAAVIAILSPLGACAVEIGVIAFQASSETHARVANAAVQRAKAKGWNVTLLNSEGSLPKHAEQFDALIAKRVDAIIVAMGKPVEADTQFKSAKDKGIPVVTVLSGTSPYTLFDIQVNEYKVGAESALYLMGLMNYRGNMLTQRFDGNVGTRIRGKVLDAVLSENTAVKELGKHSMARTQSWRDDVRSGMSALLLKHQGQFQGIWASFDGQAFVIDDLLAAQGFKKGQIPLVSTDGGDETYRRIADPKSMLVATVAIPFEQMGNNAVDAIESIVIKKQPATTVTSGPYLYMDSILVDGNNVKQFLK